MEKVYKVVRKLEDGSLRSAVISDDQILVSYEIGVWAEPRITGSYLYAFGNVWDARRFRRQLLPLDRVVILECQAETIPATPRICSEFFNLDETLRWWLERAFWGKMSDAAPGGTVWCTKIMPVKEVEDA